MAELVVVSAIVLVTLVSLYTSFNKIYSIYKSKVGYYDVATLYRAGYYRDILNEYDLMDAAKERALNNKIVTVYKDETFNGLFLSLPSDTDLKNEDNAVFLIYNNKNKIDSSIFGSIVVNSTFKDYVDYLKDSVDFSEFEYMLIMERCNLDTSGNRNINSCNYSYLEIFPESNNSNNNNNDNSDDDNSDDDIVNISCNPVLSYSCSNDVAGNEPYAIVYDGKCKVIDDKNGNWRIKFLSTGSHTLKVNCDMEIDAFLVGGGGGGGVYYGSPCGGGGGGYTGTFTNISLTANQSYGITIGRGGAASTAANSRGGNGDYTRAFNKRVEGGYASGGGGFGIGANLGGNGGSGGGSGFYANDDGESGMYYNGGAGGSYGGSGKGGYPGKGQGHSTCEFGAGTIYGCFQGVDAYSPGGGGGGAWYGELSSKGAGLKGDNSGAGGSAGGMTTSAEAGSSGVVVIRNAREAN